MPLTCLQQAADEFWGNDLVRAREEAFGDGWEGWGRGGYGSGRARKT